MANAIQTIIARVKTSIPEEILNLAFLPDSKHMTVDQCILEEVVYPTVYSDLNLVAGKKLDIYLDPAWAEDSIVPHSFLGVVGPAYCVFRVPPEAREGRNLTECISCSFPYGSYNGTVGIAMPNNSYGNTLGGTANAVMNGHTWGANASTPRPILLAGDLIMLTPVTGAWQPALRWMVTCRLEYDDEFTNLNNSAIVTLRNIVVKSVKAYIYNTLIVKTGKFFADYGIEVGEVKQIIESYSNELDDYDELLKEFHGTAYHMDPQTFYKEMYDLF